MLEAAGVNAGMAQLQKAMSTCGNWDALLTAVPTKLQEEAFLSLGVGASAYVNGASSHLVLFQQGDMFRSGVWMDFLSVVLEHCFGWSNLEFAYWAQPWT